MTLTKFYAEVISEAQKLGYSLTQVNAFRFDIEECFWLGKTVEETISEIF